MTAVPAEQTRFDRKRTLIMMDDLEMVLQMLDPAEGMAVEDQKLSPEAPCYLAELQAQLYSAASMVLDREEIEALEKELGRA